MSGTGRRAGIAATVVVSGLFVLTACGGTTGSVTGHDAPAADTAGAGAPSVAATSKAPSTAALGDAFTYKDGLSVNISRLAPFTVSEYAAGAKEGDSAVTFTVKIKNGTKKPFDTALFTLNLKVGPEGVTAEQIFDGEKVGMGFSGTIIPGSAATVKFAYDIPKGAKGNLDIEASPNAGMEYTSMHWIGKTP
jgi:hypothetical protein